MELTAAPSISDTRTAALLDLMARLGAPTSGGTLDLTSLLVYRIDSVPDSALPFLAWQFDILSVLWQIVQASDANNPAGSLSWDALTDIDTLIDVDTLAQPGSTSTTSSSQQVISVSLLPDQPLRDLLKIAIPLHQIRGTPAAVIGGMQQLGWQNAELLEGESSWGGSTWGPDGWALFRIVINLAADEGVAATDIVQITAVANFLKNARSWLDSVQLTLALPADSAPTPTDQLIVSGIAESGSDQAPSPTDGALTLAVVTPPLTDTFGPIVANYSAPFRYSGITYGANQPIVADPALTLNGQAILQGG